MVSFAIAKETIIVAFAILFQVNVECQWHSWSFWLCGNLDGGHSPNLRISSSCRIYRTRYCVSKNCNGTSVEYLSNEQAKNLSISCNSEYCDTDAIPAVYDLEQYPVSQWCLWTDWTSWNNLCFYSYLRVNRIRHRACNCPPKGTNRTDCIGKSSQSSKKEDVCGWCSWSSHGDCDCNVDVKVGWIYSNRSCTCTNGSVLTSWNTSKTVACVGDSFLNTSCQQYCSGNHHSVYFNGNSDPGKTFAIVGIVIAIIGGGIGTLAVACSVVYLLNRYRCCKRQYVRATFISDDMVQMDGTM